MDNKENLPPSVNIDSGSDRSQTADSTHMQFELVVPTSKHGCSSVCFYYDVFL